MLAKKFLIFMDENMDFSIHLAMVNFHKDIKVPSNTAARCGGGWWSFDDKTGTLRLYDDSADFGKYKKNEAQEAFDAKRVFYFGEECYEEFNMKKIQLE